MAARPSGPPPRPCSPSWRRQPTDSATTPPPGPPLRRSGTRELPPDAPGTRETPPDAPGSGESPPQPPATAPAAPDHDQAGTRAGPGGFPDGMNGTSISD